MSMNMKKFIGTMTLAFATVFRACFGFDTNAFREAIVSGEIGKVQRMLKEGASPNIVWGNGGTPLLTASGRNQLEVVKLLVGSGATNLEERETWMDSGETALIKAVKKGYFPIAATLIRAGAKLNTFTKSGWTPLLFAARNNDIQTIEALIEGGASIDATNAEGFTALMIASDLGNYEAVSALCKKHADVNHFALGFTPLKLAINKGHDEVVDILKTWGANASLGISHTAAIAEKKASNDHFFYEVKKKNKRVVVRLGYQGRARQSISMELFPSLGNRIVSLRVGTNELLFVETNQAQLLEGGGIPILYPTPNRVENGKFTFDNTPVLMKTPVSPSPMIIHGLMRDSSWCFEAPVLFQDRVEFRAWQTMSTNDVRFSAFPWPHKISVTYAVMSDRVRISYVVTNEGPRRFGFGFGLHPYWRIIGAPEKTSVQIGVNGTLKNMADTSITPLDDESRFLSPRPVSAAFQSAMFFPRTPKSAVGIYFNAIGLHLSQIATGDFTHLVLWSPQERKFIAMEDQTCSADAHNQFQNGAKDTSHLMIVEPGEAKGGSVEYVFD